MTYGIDFAWAQIPSPAIKAAGADFVVRYLGGSARLTPVERDNHHAAGVDIALVFEQEASLAEGGYARGVRAAEQANAEADSLGYPRDCLLLYADDNNDPDPNQEVAFEQGVKSVNGRPDDMYSGGNVLVALGPLSTFGGWMVETWFPHSGANPFMTQLANTRDPIHIRGISDDQFDTNVLHRAVPMWGPNGVTNAAAPPQPTSGDDVTYKEVKADGTVVYWKQGIGDYFAIPEAVALGEQLNGHGKPVPINTTQRIGLGIACNAQADAFLMKLPAPAVTVDIDALAKAVAAELGHNDAASVADELAKRLSE